MATTGDAAKGGHRTGLVALGSFFAYGLGLSVIYARTGTGLPCPSRSVTGWSCPLCGGTQMGGALVDLEVAAAFAYNPVAFLALVVLAALGLLWTAEAVGGPRMRLRTTVIERARQVHPTRWAVIGVVGAVLYTVLRNVS